MLCYRSQEISEMLYMHHVMIEEILESVDQKQFC